MNGYRWTVRVTLVCLVILAVFPAAVRMIGLPSGGVKLEAFAVTALMTAPLMLGTALVAALATSAFEDRLT